MPNLAKFGAGSSRAFGFRGKVFKLFTQTFTSSQNFTMPSGVTKLLTFSGKAQDGAAGYDYSFGAVFWAGYARNRYKWNDGWTGNNYGTPGLAADFGVVDRVQAVVNYINSFGGVASISGYPHMSYSAADDLDSVTHVVNGQYTYPIEDLVYGGSGYIHYPWGPNGNVSYAVYNNHYGTVTSFQAQIGYTGYGYNPPTTGASGSAFGISLPGGDGGTATTVTQSNVTVVPGQVYSLSIPSGGSVTITYSA